MGLQSKIGKKLRAVVLWTDGQTDRRFASPGKLTTIIIIIMFAHIT